MPYNPDIAGFMSIESLKAVERLAQRVPEKGIIVEIGAFMGRSAWTFAKSAHSSVTVYCLDLWEPPEKWIRSEHLKETFYGRMGGHYNPKMKFDLETFKQNVKDCPNIVPLLAHSTENDWPESKKADLVFIDGDHTSPQVDRDIEYWSKRLKPGGILAGHDFTLMEYPDVCQAVIRTSEKMNKPIKFFKQSSVWMIELVPSDWLDDDMYVSNGVVLDYTKEVLKIIHMG